MKYLNNKNKQGFTMIELVIGIGIIAALSLIVTINFNSYTQKADDSKNLSNVKTVHSAAETVIQTNPNIYIKDLAYLSESSNPKKSEITKQIASYANVSPTKIKIVNDVMTAHKNMEGVFYISPDSSNTQILVRFNSVKSNYLYNGTRAETEYVKELKENLFDTSKMEKGYLTGSDTLGNYGLNEATSEYIEINPLFRVRIKLRVPKNTPSHKWFSYIVYDSNKVPLAPRNNNHLTGTTNEKVNYVRDVIVPSNAKYIRVSARYLINKKTKLTVIQVPK